MPRLRIWRSQGSHSSETWTQYVVQPTQCINDKTFLLEKSPENSSEAETWLRWNSNLTCCWLGALLTPPFRVFLSTIGPKIAQAWQKSVGSRHSLFECVYQIWGLYITFKAMNTDKWLRPIFGCKVGQSVQIRMKLELDVWHHLLDVYAKFQTDISKRPKKVRKTFRWLGALVTPPLQVLLSARGPKIAQSWRKSVGIKTLTT